jgi:hypothetical protein
VANEGMLSNSLFKPTFRSVHESQTFHRWREAVETSLFSGILLENTPILNDIYQADFTLNYVAA